MTAQGNKVNFHISLGEVVKAWRQEQDLTVTELAARADTAKGYISEVENNKIHRPNDEQLIRLAKALEIPVEFLILRRLPSDLSPDERKEVDEAWRTSTTNSTSKEAGKSKRGGFGFSAPHEEPEARLKEEEALRQMLLFIEELWDEEKQLHQQQEQIQRRLVHIKELRAMTEKLIAARGR